VLSGGIHLLDDRVPIGALPEEIRGERDRQGVFGSANQKIGRYTHRGGVRCARNSKLAFRRRYLENKRSDSESERALPRGDSKNYGDKTLKNHETAHLRAASEGLGGCLDSAAKGGLGGPARRL